MIGAPRPSGARDDKDDIDFDDPKFTMGQKIFRTKLTCLSDETTPKIAFNIWLHELVKGMAKELFLLNPIL